MAVVSRFIRRLGGWEYIFPCLLLVINLAIHISIIQNPPALVQDEFYYVVDARRILQEHATGLSEHPPLGKLFVALGIAIFGDNPVGWRIFPVLFGTASIFLFYLICRRLHMSRKAANIASFLLTFENLSFVHGGIAMLDVFSLTFMLFAFWFYLKRSYPASSISIVLAALAKLTGIFAMVTIFLHWLITGRKEKVYFLASMALAVFIFPLLTFVFESAIYRRPIDPISSILTMVFRSASTTFTDYSHPFATRPWDWLILPRVMPYFYNPHYFGAISFTLWFFIIPAFCYMAFRAIKKNEAGLFGAMWFIGTYLVWIPLDLITDRLTYVYYFYPTVGAICIGLGMGLSRMIDFWGEKRTGKLRLSAMAFVILFLLLHFVVFIILAPVNPWPVEKPLIPLM